MECNITQLNKFLLTNFSEPMEQKKLIKTIMDGKIYAQVQHVAKSGMSRCIAFYYVNKDKKIQNISQEIHELNRYGKYKDSCIVV